MEVQRWVRALHLDVNNSFYFYYFALKYNLLTAYQKIQKSIFLHLKIQGSENGILIGHLYLRCGHYRSKPIAPQIFLVLIHIEVLAVGNVAIQSDPSGPPTQQPILFSGLKHRIILL